MIIVNYRSKKKYTNYISVYTKIKIVKTSNYDLSYTRYYYVVIAIKTFIIIFLDH